MSDVRLALAGIRVLDLSQHATGPFATQIMAALGATVVKIEQPPHGDRERRTEYEMFLACNRGKHSIALNLKDDADLAVLRDLVADADVFVEGFRPSVAARLGVSFADLSKIARQLVYVSMPGFGSAGPLVDAPGYDVEFRALAGDLALNATQDGTPQYARAAPVFDYAAAMYATIGVLSALLDPCREAVHLEVPILAAGLALNFARLIDPRYARGMDGQRWQHIYRCKDDRYLTITVGQDAHFRAMCDALDLPELNGRDDLRTIAGRHVASVELGELVARVIATATRDEWCQRLAGAGFAYAPVLEQDEVFEHPQVQQLGVVHRDPAPYANLPIMGLPSRALVVPPAVDEHGSLLRAAGWSGIG